jgi:hypothetical protein
MAAMVVAWRARLRRYTPLPYELRAARERAVRATSDLSSCSTSVSYLYQRFGRYRAMFGMK